eukprot:GFKZ01007755.1.p1 GENE.GFKZ01007755.1~~GFKZ01007755.1.p1  ORF type:complete len:165 (-),score=16.11 GFKZ01007755.1:70-564(-)
MAFLSPPPLDPFRAPPRLARTSPRRAPLMTTPPPTDPTPSKKLPVTNTSSTPGRKLTRNKQDASTSPPNPNPNPTYADARAGDMVGAPAVGEGLGPRRGIKDKKVTRAAAIQKSKGFADAWAEQNQGRVDVWLVIGALTILTPLLILAWAVATGVIPTAGLFDE